MQRILLLQMKKTTVTHEVVKWNQDPDNIYLFVGDDNCLVVGKKGFTQGSADDLRQLADAVIGMRNETENSQQ